MKNNDVFEIYLKGYVDGLAGRENLDSYEQVINWLNSRKTNQYEKHIN